MANPPKRKGTAFESAVVAHIEAHGLPARRVALDDWLAGLRRPF